MLHKKCIFIIGLTIKTITPSSHHISRLEQFTTTYNLLSKTTSDVCKILNGYQDSVRLKKTAETIITIGNNQYIKNSYGDWVPFDENQIKPSGQSPDVKPFLNPKQLIMLERIKDYLRENPETPVLALLNENLKAPDKTEIDINGTKYCKACHGKWYQPDAKVYSLHPNSMPQIQSAKSLAMEKAGPFLSKKRTLQLDALIKAHDLTHATPQRTLDILNNKPTRLPAPNHTCIKVGENCFFKFYQGPWILKAVQI